MPDNIPSIGEFVKTPVKQKTKQPVYVSPEQVDFSKLNINPADMQIVSPEQNILQVHPEFKTTVTKQPITPEEEKAVGEYFKLYDEGQKKQIEDEKKAEDDINKAYGMGVDVREKETSGIPPTIEKGIHGIEEPFKLFGEGVKDDIGGILQGDANKVLQGKSKEVRSMVGMGVNLSPFVIANFVPEKLQEILSLPSQTLQPLDKILKGDYEIQAFGKNIKPKPILDENNPTENEIRKTVMSLAELVPYVVAFKFAGGLKDALKTTSPEWSNLTKRYNTAPEDLIKKSDEFKQRYDNLDAQTKETIDNIANQEASKMPETADVNLEEQQPTKYKYFYDELKDNFNVEPSSITGIGNTIHFDNGVDVIVSTAMREHTGKKRIWEDRNPDVWYIDAIISKERGKGNATVALQQLLRLADKWGITTRLEPEPINWKEISGIKGGKLTTEQLTDWYKKYGYKELEGKFLERKPEKPSIGENIDIPKIEEQPLTGVAKTPPEITTTEPTITVPEGKKMRGFFKRIKNKIAETLGPDIRDNIVKNPETYYEPQNLESIKSNLKDLTDSDLISAMSDEGLLRIPTSKDANNNIYVLKELERYNRALARGDKPLAESIINDLNGIGTTLGQLIRQYREFKTSTPDGVLDLVKKQLEESKRQLSPEQEKSLTDLSDSYFQEYNKLVELDRVVKKDYTPENIDARLKQAEVVADRQNALDKFVYQVTPRGMWDTFSTILKGNLLTFQSLLQNPVSNIILGIPDYVAKLLGTPFDYTFNKIIGKPPQIRHGFDLLWQTIKDTGAETWDALKKLKTGNIATPQSKYELKYGLRPMVSLKQALTGKNLPFNKKGKVAFYDRLQRGIEGSMGIYPEAMFRLLNLGDQPFSKPTYKNALRELGKSKGLEGIELKKFTDYPDEVSRKTAEQEALERVFAQDNRIADWVIQLKYSLGKMPVVGSLMKFISDSIVPYVKVPANFVVRVTDFMIPALSFAKGIYHFSKGNSRKGSMYIGKSIVGASMLKATNTLVDNGIITGSPSTIEKERELQFDVRPPNSINISALRRMMNGESVDWQAGDQVISYNKFGILGAFFGVMSDVPKEDKNANNKMLDDVYDLTIGALTNYPKVFKYAFDQSFLKGTNTLLSTLASGKLEDYDKLVQTWMNTVFSVFVPNQMSAVTRAHLEYMPEKRNQDSIEKLDYLIKERTLQYGAIEQDYPSKVGLWGEKIKQTPTGANAWFYNLFDLSKGQTADSDPLSNEILKLYNATNDLDVVPPVPKDKITYNGQEIELKGKRYEQFKIYVGEERRKLFEKLVANPNYQALTPENKLLLVKQAWDKGMDTGKDLMFKSEIEKKKKDKVKKPYLKDFIKKESSKSYFYLPN